MSKLNDNTMNATHRKFDQENEKYLFAYNNNNTDIIVGDHIDDWSDSDEDSEDDEFEDFWDDDFDD